MVEAHPPLVHPYSATGLRVGGEGGKKKRGKRREGKEEGLTETAHQHRQTQRKRREEGEERTNKIIKTREENEGVNK